jgi:hypothetical protein
MPLDHDKIYQTIIKRYAKYNQKIHCPLILKIMLNQGRYSKFCCEVMICESTFFAWIKTNPIFATCYGLGKMFAREAWEQDGEDMREETNPPGVISHKFEHWKMVGWSRFGVSKNSRIKLDLDPTANPSQHYSQLLVQAANGDFTASEIKQLMEAVNVGLNTHQVFELQKQIDELKSDLETMVTNKNGNNTFAN